MRFKKKTTDEYRVTKAGDRCQDQRSWGRRKRFPVCQTPFSAL